MNKLLALISLLSMVVLASCTAAATQSVEPAANETATPVEAVEPDATANPDPLAMGVHTAEDVEAYFAQWPDEHKRRLNNDIVLVYTYPDPLADWVAGAIIYDIPSVSAVHLDFDGRVDDQLTHYESEDGQARLEAILADTELMQALQTEVIGRWQPALMQDAAAYAAEQGISVDEAVAQLQVQDTAGVLGAKLETDEADTFAGLWLQHEPEFRLIVAFTENGEERIRPYIEGQPYADYVEVRTHHYSQAELLSIQQEVIMLADELDLSISSWTDIIENRVVLEVGNPALFMEAVAASGRELPEPIEVIAIDPENLSDSLQGEVESIIGPEGQTIYFPKQAPTNSYMEALFEGTLLLDENGCLRIEDDSGEKPLVIWRDDFELRVVANSVEVLNGEGLVVARVGEPLSIGGGFTDVVDIPGMSLASCHSPYRYWILGDIVPLERQN